MFVFARSCYDGWSRTHDKDEVFKKEEGSEMKRNLLVLVAAVLLTSATHAKTYTDKTFMNVRSTTQNPFAQFAGWNNHKQADDRCGTAIAATGFFQQSTDAKALGQYFSSTGINSPFVGTIKDFIGVDNVYASDKQFFTQGIFHTAGATNEQIAARTLNSKLTLRPEHSAAGLRFDLNQRLDKLVDGLFLRVTLPIANVQTKMGMYVTGTETAQALSEGIAASSLTGAVATMQTGASKKFSDYMNGGVSNTNAYNDQSALAYGKVNTASRSKTAIADIDVLLGYDVYANNDNRVAVNVGFTIPTANKSTGEFLFEPIAGSGHWAAGLGVEAEVRLWTAKDNEDRALSFLGSVDYRYLFQATEVRMSSFKFRTTAASNEMPQYLLGGKVQAANSSGNPLFPMANVLTRDHNVTPGSMVNMLADLSLDWDAFTFDLGYNLYFRDAEQVSVRSWDEGTYGVINDAFPTNNAVVVGSFKGGSGTAETYTYVSATSATSVAASSGYDGSIRKQDLIMPATPAQLTHKVLGQAAYTFKDCQYPVTLGLGAHYEFAGDNSAVQNWGINGKVGVSF